MSNITVYCVLSNCFQSVFCHLAIMAAVDLGNCLSLPDFISLGIRQIWELMLHFRWHSVSRPLTRSLRFPLTVTSNGGLIIAIFDNARGGFYLMTSIFACCILFVFPSPSPVSYVWLLSVLYIGLLPAFRSVFVGSASSKLNWDPKQVCTCVSHATPSWRSHLTLSVRLVYTLPYLQWRIGMLLIFLTSRMVLSAMSCPHGNNVTSVVGWLIYLFFLLPTTLAGKSEGFW